jgi:hypothetical protein
VIFLSLLIVDPTSPFSLSKANVSGRPLLTSESYRFLTIGSMYLLFTSVFGAGNSGAGVKLVASDDFLSPNRVVTPTCILFLTYSR